MQNQENNFTVDTQEVIENANQNLKFASSNKVIVGAILLICIIGTLLLINGGNDLCLFSTCGDSRFHTTTFTSDFWSYAGGAATILVLTSFLGMSILPAVGISAGIWLLIYTSLHLS
ncbi:hypothetical protein [Calothrix sp. UHCC 0171]|uniref:hypothetical protein n=1 Tax=Calothrix sp. UHCC 0171 TaxID=3110245 RepID=UPI002B1E91DD|nr:hypothetical protein [Calothrix sp. UHCC 0171]MEA5573800.1 hypothetical protein [Calothrix sp. UHCC 0171]